MKRLLRWWRNWRQIIPVLVEEGYDETDATEKIIRQRPGRRVFDVGYQLSVWDGFVNTRIAIDDWKYDPKRKCRYRTVHIPRKLLRWDVIHVYEQTGLGKALQ